MMLDLVSIFGRLHPVVLHVPLGLLAGLAILEVAAFFRNKPPAPRLLVLLAACGAALAAASGLVLQHEPGFGGDLLRLHRPLGIATAIGASICLAFRMRADIRSYRIALLATILAMTPAGHFGATLVHGEGYLLGSTQAEDASDSALSLGDPPLLASFTDHVAPILEARCISCHGGRKKKGGLRLDSPEGILAGGEGGPALESGVPKDSEFLFRLLLPLDDDDHMPPEGRRQPPVAELVLLEAWVASGYPFTEPFGLGEGAEIPQIPDPSEKDALEPAPGRALAVLRSRLVHVQPVASDTHELLVDFAAPAAEIHDADVRKLLGPVEGHVAELALARTQITDSVIEFLAEMPRLRRLDLRQTAISDAGLASLKGHEKLEELVLVRTSVSDASLASLLELPSLSRLWVWESGIGAEALATFRAQRSDVRVDAGDTADSVALETEADPVLTGDAPPVGGPDPGLDLTSFKPVNDTCPVSGSPVDPAFTILYEGRAIGFCCSNCPKTFWQDPGPFLAKLP